MNQGTSHPAPSATAQTPDQKISGFIKRVRHGAYPYWGYILWGFAVSCVIGSVLRFTLSMSSITGLWLIPTIYQIVAMWFAASGMLERLKQRVRKTPMTDLAHTLMMLMAVPFILISVVVFDGVFLFILIISN